MYLQIRKKRERRLIYHRVEITPYLVVKSNVADPDPVFFGHKDPDPKKRIRVWILITQTAPSIVAVVYNIV